VETKKVNFSDFERILTENQGKPIYKRNDDKYVMFWSIGGFVYQTEVTFKQIHESYKKQFGKQNNKASIETFFNKYLVDAYEEVSEYKKEEIELLMDDQEVRQQEEKPENKYKYFPITQLKNTIRKTTWMESDKDGGYIIKAINDKNAVITVGEVKRIDGRLTSSVDDPSKTTTQVRREKIDIQKSSGDQEEFNTSKHKTK